MPLARVVGAKNHAALGDFQARIHSACDRAGVDVSRMGNDASEGGDAAGLDWRSVFSNLAQQLFSAARIKPAGDGGSSYSGNPQWPPRRGVRLGDDWPRKP